MNANEKYSGWLSYIVAIILMVVSFILPPEGVIDPSVLLGASILIAGQQLIWGNKIKEINLDKSGLHVVTKD